MEHLRDFLSAQQKDEHGYLPPDKVAALRGSEPAPITGDADTVGYSPSMM